MRREQQREWGLPEAWEVTCWMQMLHVWRNFILIACVQASGKGIRQDKVRCGEGRQQVFWGLSMEGGKLLHTCNTHNLQDPASTSLVHRMHPDQNTCCKSQHDIASMELATSTAPRHADSHAQL